MRPRPVRSDGAEPEFSMPHIEWRKGLHEGTLRQLKQSGQARGTSASGFTTLRAIVARRRAPQSRSSRHRTVNRKREEPLRLMATSVCCKRQTCGRFAENRAHTD